MPGNRQPTANLARKNRNPRLDVDTKQLIAHFTISIVLVGKVEQ